MGAQECDVYNNVMSDSTQHGVFFYRGSDEAEVRYHTDPSLGKKQGISLQRRIHFPPDGCYTRSHVLDESAVAFSLISLLHELHHNSVVV